ncbi:hypothetical protein [Lysinibacillus xylanilyticus]|uniref:hypothetical protein n=1 Tax=Lysinibacillus xylanilyticus TaxID=582475 RepID=UPI003D00B50D
MSWLIGVEAGRPQEALLCAKAKRQKMFCLCESEATATKRPAGTEINPSFC